jgi:hypothetical protein
VVEAEKRVSRLCTPTRDTHTKDNPIKNLNSVQKEIEKTADDDQADFARNPNLILREHPHDKQTKTHMHTLTS